MFEAQWDATHSVSVVDLGGTLTYWEAIPSSLLDRFNVSVTIVNLTHRLSTKPKAEGRYRFVEANACRLECFESQEFDIAHSNSVIEHVGDWQRMRQYACEVSRVAKWYFVQTPSFSFPLEPHSMTLGFHWLPRPAQIWLVSNRQLGHWRQAASLDEAVRTVESVNLLTKRMITDLFPDARLEHERVGPLTKSLLAIRGPM
jgi:hypothetical protein